MTHTEITIEQWRESLKEHSRFNNFWSNVSNIRVAKTADPALVRKLVDASEKAK